MSLCDGQPRGLSFYIDLPQSKLQAQRKAGRRWDSKQPVYLCWHMASVVVHPEGERVPMLRGTCFSSLPWDVTNERWRQRKLREGIVSRSQVLQALSIPPISPTSTPRVPLFSTGAYSILVR